MTAFTLHPHTVALLALMFASLCLGEAGPHTDPAASAYRQAYGYLTSNRYVEAAACFETAAATTNADMAAAAWLGRGEALYGAKQWDAAIASYDALLKIYPHSPHAAQALYARGFTEFQSGRLPQALATLSTFTAHYPSHALAATAVASTGTITRTLAVQKRQREVETVTRELTAINTLSREGKPSEAATAAGRFLQAHPSHPQAAELRYLVANCALLAKDYAKAVDAYRDYLTHHPQHVMAARAQFELGSALRALAHYEEAADAYAAAASQPRAANERAECLLSAHRIDEARLLFEVLARDSSSPQEQAQAELAIGDCCVAQQKWEEAERAFLSVEVLQAAEALRPAALGRLASVYEKMGQSDKAAKTREELKRQFPDRK